MLISDWSSDVCSSDLGAFDMEIGLRQMRSRLGFERFELAETSRGGFAFHGGASAFGDRFPGVGLIVHFRGAGTGGASAGGAVVLAFEGDAEAFFHGVVSSMNSRDACHAQGGARSEERRVGNE